MTPDCTMLLPACVQDTDRSSPLFQITVYMHVGDPTVALDSAVHVPSNDACDELRQATAATAALELLLKADESVSVSTLDPPPAITELVLNWATAPDPFDPLVLAPNHSTTVYAHVMAALEGSANDQESEPDDGVPIARNAVITVCDEASLAVAMACHVMPLPVSDGADNPALCVLCAPINTVSNRSDAGVIAADDVNDVESLVVMPEIRTVGVSAMR